MAQRKQQSSDHRLRASRVFAKALELFDGDRDAALRWMQTPLPALGGETPIHIARTELGARQAENLVGRIEHGAYS
jgi:putative toxin-antitoxin system antitoxin component (TIGR02293 family)